MFSKLLLIVDVHTTFEVSNFSLSGDIRDINIKKLDAVCHLEFDRK